MTIGPNSNPSILITGAAGFVGRHIVAGMRYHWPSADIVMPNRNLNGRRGVDLCNVEELREFIDSRDFTHVVHASGGHAHLSESEQFQMHVSATQSLIDVLMGAGHAVRWINIGSSSQYGRQDPKNTPLLSEEHPDHPLSPYAKSKSQQENLLREAAQTSRIDPVYLRLFNPIGSGQQGPFLVPNLIKQILDSSDRCVRLRIDDPWTTRDFVDVRDTAEAVVSVMAAPGVVGQQLNVCSGQATTNADLARLLAKIAGRGCEIIGTGAAEPDIPYQCGSRRKIYDLCGWIPRYSLEDTLAEIWETVARNRSPRAF